MKLNGYLIQGIFIFLLTISKGQSSRKYVPNKDIKNNHDVKKNSNVLRFSRSELKTMIEFLSNNNSSKEIKFGLKKLKDRYGEDVGDDIEQVIAWKSILNSMDYLNKGLKRRRRVKRDEEVVCYEELGCYRDGGFFGYMETLPESPEEIGTKFILYNQHTPSHGEIIDYRNASSLYYSKFSNSHPVKVIIHGFGGGGNSKWAVEMKNALLKYGHYNIIIVDWENGSDYPNYVQAAANTKLVGRQLSRVIEMINLQRGKTNQDYHIIGFSLGAHVAGFAGMASKNISRITGLDPASPLFEGYKHDNRLDATDAKFVDIIHSNGERLFFGGLGSIEQMGDVDYYPNGGKSQAGCSNLIVGAVSDLFSGEWNSLCNHRRAYLMFTASIHEQCLFPSFACDSFKKFLDGECFPCNDDESCGNMGFHADKTKGRGKLYLVTPDKRPFCANQYMIEVNSSFSNKKTWGRVEITLIAKNGDNETFALTEDSDEITAGMGLKKVVVAHPELKNIDTVQLRYIQYDGWIYDGEVTWSINSLRLVDTAGKKLYYCGFPVKLRSNIPVVLPVDTVECPNNANLKLGPPAPVITISKSNRGARLLWVHNNRNKFPYPYFVPNQSVKTSRYIKVKMPYSRSRGRHIKAIIRYRQSRNRNSFPTKEVWWNRRNYRPR